MKAPRTYLLLFLLLVQTSRGMAALGAEKERPAGDPLPVSANELLPLPTEARRLALESAGSFTKDGFRIHDGEWSSSLGKGIPLFLQLTLFAGNHYRLVIASPTAGAKLLITLYDAPGLPVKNERWEENGGHEGACAATGITPGKSGKYFVGVELLESPSDQPVDFCLLSAYK